MAGWSPGATRAEATEKQQEQEIEEANRILMTLLEPPGPAPQEPIMIFTHT